MTTTAPAAAPNLQAELAEAPDLAAVAAAHPLVFADLVRAWADPDPITDLVCPSPDPRPEPEPSTAPRPRPTPARPRRPLVLPDAPSVTRERPLRQYREPHPLFDPAATPEDIAYQRPRR